MAATRKSVLQAAIEEIDARMFHPNWCIRPGFTLKEWLEDQHISQREMAERLNITQKHLSQIITGKATYSPALAVRLARETGVSPEFWYRLQAAWVIGKAEGKKEVL